MTSSELIALARRIAVARQASAARFREIDTLTPGREAPTWIIDTELAGRDHAHGQIELVEEEDPDLRAARLAELFEPLPMDWITRVPTQDEARDLVESASSDDDVIAVVGDELAHRRALAAPAQAEQPDDQIDQERSVTPSASNELDSDQVRPGAVLQEGAHPDTSVQPESISPEHHGEEIESEEGFGPTPAAAAIVTGIDEATHEAAVLAARQQGYEEGLAAARAELLASVEVQRAELSAFMQSFREQTADAAKLFEPLKRLSLHLAQELVRGELNLSGDAIARLVDACLLEVDRRTGRDLLLSLNPADLERWRTHAGTVLDGIETRADAGLSRGSVRLSVGETVIEDLIENRLQTLSRQLLGDPHAWRGAGSQPRASFPLARTDSPGLSTDMDVVDVG
jgi:flagellar biosynthesis/type III secretory pathway protein FliH